MSLVSSRVSLTHLCTIERDANLGTPDDWGTPSTPDWQDHLTDQPCRIWAAAGREQMDSSTTAVIEELRMIVPLGTDVTEKDRVGDVTYRGSTIFAGPIGIRAVLHREDHLALVLSRVSG